MSDTCLFAGQSYVPPLLYPIGTETERSNHIHDTGQTQDLWDYT